MTRWSLVLPRLILALILLSVVSLGIDPALRWALTSNVGTALGVKFHAGRAHASWRSGRAVVEQLTWADPDDPTQQRLRAGQAVLEFDPWALAQRRLVIHRAEVKGLRLQADARAESLRRDAAQARLAGQAAALGEAWKRAVAADPLPHLQTVLKSVQMADSLGQQRARQYQKIVQELAQWQTRFEELSELVSLVGDNPLRMTPDYRARLEELASVGQEMDDLQQQLAVLRRHVQEDRQLLEQTRTDDVAELRRQLTLEPIDGQQLAEYLLEDEWSGRISAWVTWVRQARRLVARPSRRERFCRANTRGVDVLFNAGRQGDLVLENLFLKGTGRIGGEDFRLHGTLTNFSDEPQLLDEPTVLTLAACGRQEMQMEAVFDRTGSRPLDRVRIVCPELRAPQRVWGDPQQFAVEVGPGAVQVAMLLELRGEEIRGQVNFQQNQAELTPSWPGSKRDQPVNESINVALREVQSVCGSLRLTGTLDYPIWRLESKLGDQVAQRMRKVLQTEFAQRAEELTSKGEQLASDAIDRLARQLAEQDELAERQLTAKGQQLQQFRQRLARHSDLMDDQMDDQLTDPKGPLENLLRR